MKILFAAAEMAPFARTGGLGDVVEALPAALGARGHDVSVILPCYHGLREDAALGVTSTKVQLTVQVGSKRPVAEILQCTASNGVQVFLVRNDGYFDREGLYGLPGGSYDDNAERFIFFSKVIVELARRIVPPPEIIHVHDWQTGLVPVLIKERRLPFRSVLTIHNLGYQGNFWAPDFGMTNLPGDYFTAKGVEFYGQLNLLKGGILFADQVTTVSERYALEIQTPELGSGLHAVLREHAGKLTGILNGADYSIWNPATDRALPAAFGPDDLQGKIACREKLLAEVGLAPSPSAPVFAIVSRLAGQKGIDLLIPLLDRLLAHDVRLVILGQGEPQFERELAVASRRHAERFCYRQSMDENLAHLIYAGADVFLIPSHYEPCGMTAMYALKYGTIPVAHATGGLYQMIQDYDPANGTGNGILFHQATPEAFWDALVRTLRYHADAEHWKSIVRRAMECDFSWDRSVPRFEAIYQRAITGR